MSARRGADRDKAVLETALLSRLRMLDRNVYESLPDGGDGAGARLWKAVREESTLENIAQAARTKRYPARTDAPHAAVRRARR